MNVFASDLLRIYLILTLENELDEFAPPPSFKNDAMCLLRTNFIEKFTN